MLEHGGRLRLAAARYGIPLADWLDLSTGVNPNGWPVPALPACAWARLPEDNDELEPAAHDYYGTDCLLPVAGSQAAIQALPLLRALGRVGVLSPSYAEHVHAWRRAGHAVVPIAVDDVDIERAAAQLDVMVLCHPNNPTGARFSREQLVAWRQTLSARDGWLVVDEAFMDPTPEHSLGPLCPQPGLIVLRSLGKFFGLAGARVGFACAAAPLLDKLRAQLGPWTVAAPSRWAARRALSDRAWQAATREKLQCASARLAVLLRRHGLTPAGGCALFQWVRTPRAPALHDRLARRGILTRLFVRPSSLRFGLPATEPDWARLHAALVDVCPADSAGVPA